MSQQNKLALPVQQNKQAAVVQQINVALPETSGVVPPILNPLQVAVLQAKRKTQQAKKLQRKLHQTPMWIKVLIILFGVGCCLLGIYLTFYTQKSVKVKVTDVTTNAYTFYDNETSKSTTISSEGANKKFKNGDILTLWRLFGGYKYRKRKLDLLDFLGYVLMVVVPILAVFTVYTL